MQYYLVKECGKLWLFDVCLHREREKRLFRKAGSMPGLLTSLTTSLSISWTLLVGAGGSGTWSATSQGKEQCSSKCTAQQYVDSTSIIVLQKVFYLVDKICS